MQPIAIAICLTHEGFGAVILAFDKAIGNAYRQKLEKGENFLSPILEGRERLAHLGRPMQLDLLDPGIEFLWWPTLSGSPAYSVKGSMV